MASTKVTCALFLSLLVVSLMVEGEGAPYFDSLYAAFGGYGRSRGSYPQAPAQPRSKTYREICLVHSQDPFGPYPKPACPF